jgi:hypothetical protein
MSSAEVQTGLMHSSFVVIGEGQRELSFKTLVRLNSDHEMKGGLERLDKRMSGLGLALRAFACFWQPHFSSSLCKAQEYEIILRFASILVIIWYN